MVAPLPLRLPRPGPGSATGAPPFYHSVGRSRGHLGPEEGTTSRVRLSHPERLGEPGRGSVMEFRVVELIPFRESGARRGSGRVSRRPVSGGARVPLRPPRAPRAKAAPRLCLLAGGGLASATAGVQVVLFEGVGYADLLVSRRTSFILKQLNCGSHHITFLLIRLFPPQ